MIIYGSKATQIATKNTMDKCQNCGNQNSVQMSVFQKYAHVFWIPLFPMGKIGVTQCSHCKQTLVNKDFQGILAEMYKTEKINTKTPLWTFSGLIILTIMVVWGGIIGAQDKAKNAQLILAPQKGDIYEIKADDKQYTIYKVDSVVEDAVYLLVNKYETNQRAGLADLKNKGAEAYEEEAIPVDKTTLKSMFDRGEIIDIDR